MVLKRSVSVDQQPQLCLEVNQKRSGLEKKKTSHSKLKNTAVNLNKDHVFL